MRVGFLTPWSVDDPASWSGVVAPMFTALARCTDVVPVRVPQSRAQLVDRVATRVLTRGGHGYLPGHGLATSRASGPPVAAAVSAASVDVVLSVAASTQLAYARLPVPVVEVGDATFRLLVGYYPLFTDLHRLGTWQGEVLGRRSARCSAAFLLTSQWAAASLAGDYGVDAARIRVAPFGPSLVSPSAPSGPRHGDPLRILFVGSDWVRKGGDVAVEIATTLERRGVPCRLTIVGAAPEVRGPVARLGRVERGAMAALYASHDVLLEPARANAGGVTLTDATASGLPVVATRTGGVPDIVEDGVSGFLVDPDDPVEPAVAALARLTDAGVWRSMSAASRHRGEAELSWLRWATTAVDLCTDVVDRSS